MRHLIPGVRAAAHGLDSGASYPDLSGRNQVPMLARACIERCSGGVGTPFVIHLQPPIQLPDHPLHQNRNLMPTPSPCSLLRSSARPAPPSSRGPRLPRGPSHRTGLVGRTSGSSGRRGPGLPPYSGAGVSTRSYPSPSVSWTGATTTRDRSSLHRSTSDTSPRSAKYALRSPRSTGEKWLKAHQDRRSW